MVISLANLLSIRLLCFLPLCFLPICFRPPCFRPCFRPLQCSQPPSAYSAYFSKSIRTRHRRPGAAFTPRSINRFGRRTSMTLGDRVFDAVASPTTNLILSLCTHGYKSCRVVWEGGLLDGAEPLVDLRNEIDDS
ncbi:hypothetical protein F4779DRAFT_606289, partial [Xylariaceae sp. FL0662B]